MDERHEPAQAPDRSTTTDGLVIAARTSKSDRPLLASPDGCPSARDPLQHLRLPSPPPPPWTTSTGASHEEHESDSDRPFHLSPGAINEMPSQRRCEPPVRTERTANRTDIGHAQQNHTPPPPDESRGERTAASCVNVSNKEERTTILTTAWPNVRDEMPLHGSCHPPMNHHSCAAEGLPSDVSPRSSSDLGSPDNQLVRYAGAHEHQLRMRKGCGNEEHNRGSSLGWSRRVSRGRSRGITGSSSLCRSCTVDDDRRASKSIPTSTVERTWRCIRMNC